MKLCDSCRHIPPLEMTGEPWWHKCKPRNASFILIAASAAIHNPRAGGPSNLRTLSIHNPSTQPAAPAATTTLGPGARQTYEPLGRRPIHLKNPSTQPFYTTLLHNPPPTGGHNLRPGGPSTFPFTTLLHNLPAPAGHNPHGGAVPLCAQRAPPLNHQAPLFLLLYTTGRNVNFFMILEVF